MPKILRKLQPPESKDDMSSDLQAVVVVGSWGEVAFSGASEPARRVLELCSL